MDNFVQADIAEVSDNFIDAIAKGWMLITAGDRQKCNTMTASWGMMGEMWGRHVAMVVIRPQRYTREFADSGDMMTLSFFDETHRAALQYCGSRSGRDEDKIPNAGLSVVFTDAGVPAIAEARLIVECRKLYADDFREEMFTDKTVMKGWYPKKDLHKMYIMEITNTYIRR